MTEHDSCFFFPQPENILVTGPGLREIRLVDFGLARRLVKGKPICELLGTTEYVGKLVGLLIYKKFEVFCTIDPLHFTS